MLASRTSTSRVIPPPRFHSVSIRTSWCQESTHGVTRNSRSLSFSPAGRLTMVTTPFDQATRIDVYDASFEFQDESRRTSTPSSAPVPTETLDAGAGATDSGSNGLTYPRLFHTCLSASSSSWRNRPSPLSRARPFRALLWRIASRFRSAEDETWTVVFVWEVPPSSSVAVTVTR